MPSQFYENILKFQIKKKNENKIIENFSFKIFKIQLDKMDVHIVS